MRPLGRVAIEGSTVVVASVFSGAERRIERADTVVLSLGSPPPTCSTAR